MKKITLLLITYHLSLITLAQNLVPNPSFEEYTDCPNNLNQVSKANGWSIHINTPDYYNACGTTFFSPPNSAFGYQCPATGSAYCGIYCYSEVNPGNHEFFGRQLLTPLVVGQKYFVSFKASLADVMNCGIDKVGILFTNTFYGDTFITPAPVFSPQIYSSNIILDTTNWSTISGSFIADSAYQYIIIGRFHSDSGLSILCTDTNSKWSYYYIDDVCVSTDSLTCIIANGPNICDSIEDVLKSVQSIQEPIVIFPNPINQKININLPFNIEEAVIKIYNSIGELIYKKDKCPNNVNIDLSKHIAGIYFIEIQIKDQITIKKLIKTN